MAELESKVGWHAALYIWWSEVWRIFIIYFGIGVLVMAVNKLTPVVYNTASRLVVEYEGTTLLLILLFHFYIHMRAIRESFTDSYATFSFDVKNKHTQRSALGLDRRLISWDVLAVWWAQTWRMFLLPCAIVAGYMYFVMKQHPTAANYTHLLDNSITRINFYAAFVLSLWAVKQSLGDKYRTIGFIATPKDFYNRP